MRIYLRQFNHLQNQNETALHLGKGRRYDFAF